MEMPEPPSKLTSLYVFVRLDKEEVCYVGKADDMSKRLKAHLREARAGKKGRKNNWLRKHHGPGHPIPRMELLAEVPASEWQFWERHYIKYFRELGFDLLNITPGGDGTGSGVDNPCFGRAMAFSPEHRRKLQIAATGRIKSPEHCRNISRGKAGKKMTLETIAIMRACRLGKKQSPERVAASIGKKRSPEARANMLKAQQARRVREQKEALCH